MNIPKIVLGIGKSMKPTFNYISLVRIEKTNSYKVGDIISLITNDNFRHIHRVIKINEKYVSVKGDNCEQQWYEKDIPVKNIEGKITWSWPK